MDAGYLADCYYVGLGDFPNVPQAPSWPCRHPHMTLMHMPREKLMSLSNFVLGSLASGWKPSLGAVEAFPGCCASSALLEKVVVHGRHR